MVFDCTQNKIISKTLYSVRQISAYTSCIFRLGRNGNVDEVEIGKK